MGSTLIVTGATTFTGALTATNASNDIQGVTLDATADVYQAALWFNRAGATDRWDVQWKKNGVPVAATLTTPAITVETAAASPVTLINAQAMTDVGTLRGAAFYLGTGAERTTDGTTYRITLVATIDGAPRTDTWVYGAKA